MNHFRVSPKNYLRKHHYSIAAALLALAILGGLFSTDYSTSILRNVTKPPAPTPTPAPLPTTLDENFLTQVNECFIPAAAVYGYTLRITSGFRTLEEQTELYQQGRTVDGHIVSWAESGRSIHNYGFAVDVVDRWRGFNINWRRLAKIGNYCGLEQVDDPHFEHRGGLTAAEFGFGLRPLPLILPCDLMHERALTNTPLTKKDLQTCGAPSTF